MIQDDLSTRVRPYWDSPKAIPGVFDDIDFLLFDRILSFQEQAGTPGDLLEIGALLGKSAIVVGSHAGAASKMIVCDVFEQDTDDAANDLENESSYAGLSLTRAAFEANYSEFVREKPEIIQEWSSVLPDRVPAGSVRFAHVDGGHLYETVKTDVETVKLLLNDQGIVSFDDFRANHTPGVAAAVWNAVAEGLIPICVSEAKFYGTWSQDVADRTREELKGWLGRHSEVNHGLQSVCGHELLLIANPTIWNTRRRIKAILPPVISERLVPVKQPHLGA